MTHADPVTTMPAGTVPREGQRTLVSHSAMYFASLAVPAALGIAAIAIYSRLLDSAEYGVYSLIVAFVGIGNVALFRWLRLGVLRFLPAYKEEPERFLATVSTAFLALATVTLLASVVVLVAVDDVRLRALAALALLVLWAQAWFDLQLELARSRLAPVRYGALSVARASLALGVGALLAWRGFGAVGLLVGLAIGLAVPSIVATFASKTRTSVRGTDRNLAKQLLRYGIPLALTGILGLVVSTSDRLLLSALIGTSAVGLYSVGYDLTKQALLTLMMVVNLAAYPLVVRALEDHGEAAARRQLSLNATALLGIALPASAGMVLLAPNVAHVFLGEGFREAGAVVIPWIAIAALLLGLTTYYANLSFHLARATSTLLVVSGLAAALNVVLNLVFIPAFGVVGAAYSTVAAYALMLATSAVLGRRAFRLPFPTREAAKIVTATAGMVAAVLFTAGGRGLPALLLQIGVGVVAYGALALALDVMGARSFATRAFGRWTRRTPGGAP